MSCDTNGVRSVLYYPDTFHQRRTLTILHGRRDNVSISTSLGSFSSRMVVLRCQIFHSSTGRDDAENEGSNWKRAYANMKDFPECRVNKAAEGNCLVMPYLHPIPKAKSRGTDQRWLYRSGFESFLHIWLRSSRH
jgi:hypothetical protein